MEKSTKRIITFVIICSLTLIFAGVNSVYGVSNIDTNVVTEGAFNAFYDLAKGNTAWPVMKVADNLINVNGEYEGKEWNSAVPIHIAGEWQWNQSYKNQNWLFTGAMDFVAVWRLLYDSEYLYISCEFRDDKHQEGLATESRTWMANDCAEFTFINPLSKLPTDISMFNSTLKAIQVYKKFTEASGLRGRVIASVKRADTSGTIKTFFDTVYVNDVSEGSDSLGGVKTAAKAWSNNKYAGRWFMEARVPISNFVSGELGSTILKGRAFKMNLKVYDDDLSTAPTTSNPTMGLGFERYAKWYTFGTRTLADPIPTFVFGGLSTEALPKPLPDLKNLYCGKTSSYYDSLLMDGTAVEQSKTASALFLNVSPNPVFGSSFSVMCGSLNTKATFTLYDITGKVVAVENLKNNSGRFTFSVGNNGLNLRSGKYFLRLETPENSLVRDIMIVR